MIFNGVHFQQQSMLINIGVGNITGNARGELHVKMGHNHFYGCKNKELFLEKLSLKENPKESPAVTLSGCNLDAHYFMCSCDNASSEIVHSKTCDEDFLEVRRASVYRSSKSQRKFWLGASKEAKDEGKMDSQNNSRKSKGLNGPSCCQRPAMDGIHELQKGRNDFLGTEESSNIYLNTMEKDKKLETEDLIRNMSNLPHYLQRTEKGESFQERALRFGVLDWGLLEKWNHNRGGKGHRALHSPSGSDTSSSFSTLGSSSFSCRSDLSSSAKRERSPFCSLHSYSNSAPVSSINPPYLSHTFSPVGSHAAYVEVTSTGSKEISMNAQGKTGCEVPLYEYLDLKLHQGNGMETQGSRIEIQKDACAPLEKEVTFSAHEDPDSAHFLRTGLANDDGFCGSNTKQGKRSVSELPKEHLVSGLATPGFFSAGDRSPETCSEVSLNLENVSIEFIENARSSAFNGMTQVGSLEDDLNIQFVDCYDELPAAHADGGNLIDKCAASVHDPSPHKVVTHVPISSEINQNLINLDDNSRISHDSQKYMLRNISGNAFLQGADSDDVSFRRSHSAISNELQLKNKVVDIPAMSAATFSDQQLPDTVAKNESNMGVSRTHKNRRAKSFSLSGSRDPEIDNLETGFTTPKSTDASSCHHGLSKDCCRVCKKVSVSPLRRWIDPIVKSRERHRMNLPSHAPVQCNLLHPDHDADVVLNSKAGMRRNISLRKSLAQGFSGRGHKTSRNSSVRSTSSDNQAFAAPEDDISGKHFLHISRNRCSSPGPKHGKVTERLSQFASETDIACSSMHAPPAHSPILQGLVHFVYKNGLPYFTFSLNESEEVLAAKTWKIDNSEGRDFDWMYSFHSAQSKKRSKSGWVNWGKKDNHIPDLVGNMKVSSSLCSKLNNSSNIEHFVETEFVLFGTKKRDPKDDPTTQTGHIENNSSSPSQSVHSKVSSDMPSLDSFSISTSSTSMAGDNMENVMTRSTVPSKHSDTKNEMHKLRYPSRKNFSESFQSSSTRSRSAARHVNQATSREPDILDSDIFLSSPFCHHLQLAALVIRVPLEYRESVNSGQGEDASSNKFAGWGLKFLAKSSGGSSSETKIDYPMNSPQPELKDDCHFHSLKSSNCPMEFGDISKVNSFPNSGRCSFENGSSEFSDISSSCGTQEHTSVTVIVPAGIHSQPTTNSDGPSPLIERWRSGGRCDCGGWDLGCPLTILDSQNPNKNDLPESSVEEEGFRLSDIFIQGANKGTPALSLTIVREGLYLLRFHARLSALQAFAIGVAMLHSREPFISAKETKTQECCYRSSHGPFAKHVRTLSQAIATPHDDFPISIPSNHDLFSVSCVPDPPLSPFGRV